MVMERTSLESRQGRRKMGTDGTDSLFSQITLRKNQSLAVAKKDVSFVSPHFSDTRCSAPTSEASEL